MKAAKEAVSHPTHYNMGGPKESDGTAKYEVIKVIEDWGLEFCLGNALKYILRAPHKGTGAEDMAKAHWYLSRARTTKFLYVFGACFKMKPEEVAHGWDLPESLTSVIRHIHFREVDFALAGLSAHVATTERDE